MTTQSMWEYEKGIFRKPPSLSIFRSVDLVEQKQEKWLGVKITLAYSKLISNLPNSYCDELEYKFTAVWYRLLSITWTARNSSFFSYVAPNRFHKKNYDQGYDNPGYGRYSQQQQQLLHQQDQGLEQIGKNGKILGFRSKSWKSSVEKFWNWSHLSVTKPRFCVFQADHSTLL